MADSSLHPSAEDGQQAAYTVRGTSGQAVYIGSEIHRRISVQSSSGERAAIAAIVRQGKVWVSVVPHFVGEAILDPEKADAVTRTLAQARDDARRMGKK